MPELANGSDLSAVPICLLDQYCYSIGKETLTIPGGKKRASCGNWSNIGFDEINITVKSLLRGNFIAKYEIRIEV